MGADKALTGSVKELFVNMARIVKSKPFIKGVTKGSVQNFIYVPLALCVVPGVKILRHLAAGESSNILRKVYIQRSGKAVAGNTAFGLETYAEAGSMNPCIGTGAALYFGLTAKHRPESRLKHFLHRNSILLNLPAVIGSAEKADGKQKISHCLAPFEAGI